MLSNLIRAYHTKLSQLRQLTSWQQGKLTLVSSLTLLLVLQKDIANHLDKLQRVIGDVLHERL